MTVISKDIPEAGIVLHRHSDESFYTRWIECIEGDFVPKDMSAWSAEMTLETVGCVTLATVTCTCTSDGYVIARIPQATIESLAPHTIGNWRMVASLGDVTELISDGYFEVVN